MRTTLDLNDSLLIRAKRRAASERRTLTAVVEDALRRLLEGRDAKPDKIPVIPIFGGNGVQPGVDLTNNAALQELMDEYDGKPRR